MVMRRAGTRGVRVCAPKPAVRPPVGPPARPRADVHACCRSRWRNWGRGEERICLELGVVDEAARREGWAGRERRGGTASGSGSGPGGRRRRRRQRHGNGVEPGEGRSPGALDASTGVVEVDVDVHGAEEI